MNHRAFTGFRSWSPRVPALGLLPAPWAGGVGAQDEPIFTGRGGGA